MLLLYPHADYQTGERGKKLIDRLWERNLKVQVKAAPPSPPITGKQGGWEQGQEPQSSWRGSDPAQWRSRAPPGLMSIALVPANQI